VEYDENLLKEIITQLSKNIKSIHSFNRHNLFSLILPNLYKKNRLNIPELIIDALRILKNEQDPFVIEGACDFIEILADDLVYYKNPMRNIYEPQLAEIVDSFTVTTELSKQLGCYFNSQTCKNACLSELIEIMGKIKLTKLRLTEICWCRGFEIANETVFNYYLNYLYENQNSNLDYFDSLDGLGCTQDANLFKKYLKYLVDYNFNLVGCELESFTSNAKAESLVEFFEENHADIKKKSSRFFRQVLSDQIEKLTEEPFKTKLDAIRSIYNITIPIDDYFSEENEI
jgi:hypothetical protein